MQDWLSPTDEELRFSPGRQSSTALLPPAQHWLRAEAPLTCCSRLRRRNWRPVGPACKWVVGLCWARRKAWVRDHVQPRRPSHGGANGKGIFFCVSPPPSVSAWDMTQARHCSESTRRNNSRWVHGDMDCLRDIPERTYFEILLRMEDRSAVPEHYGKFCVVL